MNRSNHSNKYFISRSQFNLSAVLQHVLLICFLCISAVTAQSSPHDAWHQGNTFYQQKKYDSAAFYFEQIAATSPADATIFYNLGNTYYRLNKVGLAVLNYERALKRKPDYKEASDNLLLAQSRIPGGITQSAPDIFFVRWWKTVTAPQTIMVWSVLSLLFFISLIGLLLYRRLKRNQVYIRPHYVGALTLLWLFSLLLAFSAAYAALSNVHGVVVSGNADLTIAGKMITVAEGTNVRIAGLKGTQYEVVLPDGRSGMLSKRAVQLID